MVEIEAMLVAVARLQLSLRLRPRALARAQLLSEVVESYRRSADAAAQLGRALEVRS
jgi:hypothetical protein